MGAEMMGILILFLLACAVAGAMIGLTTLLGPRRPNLVKDQTFECGMSPASTPKGKFSVKFYLIAMLFIVFDVEIIFLFPWAVNFRQLGMFGFMEMLFFLGVILLGFWYVWKKGALEWE